MPIFIKASIDHNFRHHRSGKIRKPQTSSLVTGALILAAFGALAWYERKRPLRRRVEPGVRRLARNAALGTLTAAVLNVLERPLVSKLTKRVLEKRWGLVSRLEVPAWIKTGLAVAAMDYTLYAWHVLLHRVPLLWRCHLVHHVDLDLDTSTALRFHFAEFVASIPWRAGQIVAIGVTPKALAIWQTLTAIEVLFHHSNARLPAQTESRLSRLLVTPRLHGIHHSIVDEERNSNFSSGLTLWDRLHGTLKTDVPQQEITIGVPGFRDPEQITLGRSLVLPLVSGAASASRSRIR